MGQSASKNIRNLPSETPTRAQGVLTNASAALFAAVPAGGTYRVYSIVLTEKSNAARTATVRFLKSGGVDDNTSDIVQALPLAALEMVLLDFGPYGLVFTGGDTLKALASANTAVNYAVNYSVER